MNVEKGKVTMVIPLYNKVSAIRKTLESVVNYHGNANFECVIIDDSSTDGSSEIAKEFETNYPDLFTYVWIRHRGKRWPSNARNFGLRLCNSEYVCFLDADDELPEGHIDRCFKFLEEHKDFGCYGEGYKRTDGRVKIANKHICNIDYFIDHSYEFNIHFCAFLYRLDALQDIKFKECPSEDMVFLFTVMLHNKFCCDMSKIGLIYHNENTLSNTKWREILDIYNFDDGYYRWKQIMEDNPDFPYYFKFTDYGSYTEWELMKYNID